MVACQFYNMEEKIISIIINGGAVGISVYALYTLRQIVGNHLEHSTKAMRDLTAAISELREAIKNHFN